MSYRHARDGIFQLLSRPGIDSQESIPPANVAQRTGTTILFLLGSLPHSKIPAQAKWTGGIDEEPPFQTRSIANSRQNLSASHGIKQVSTVSPNNHILVPVPVVEHSSSVLIVLNVLHGKSEGYLILKSWSLFGPCQIKIHKSGYQIFSRCTIGHF